MLMQLFGAANVAQPLVLLGMIKSILLLLLFVVPICFFGIITKYVQKNYSKQLMLHKGVSVLMYAYIWNFFITAFSLLVFSAFMTVHGQYVINVSLFYLQTDQWLNTYEILAVLIDLVLRVPYLLDYLYVVYEEAFVFILLAPFLLALFSYKTAREYTLAILVTTVVCLPFWYALPAIAPLHLATSESFVQFDGQQLLPERTVAVMDLYSQFETTQWGNIVHSQNAFWEQIYQSGFGFPISCNPSMHVIWGVVLAFYFIKTNRYLGIFGIIFLGTILFTTVFFLQHYLIDIFFGLAAAVLVLFLTKLLLKTETRYLDVQSENWFGFLKSLGSSRNQK